MPERNNAEHEATYRHEALASYQSGREFDNELVEQLEVLPEFVAACGFASAKAAAGYEADDFLAAAVAARGAARWHHGRCDG